MGTEGRRAAGCGKRLGRALSAEGRALKREEAHGTTAETQELSGKWHRMRLEGLGPRL